MTSGEHHAPWNAIAVQIVVGCCTAPVAFGLVKRRYWAWLLNWSFTVWIAFTFVRTPGVAGTVMAAAWMVLNGRYFAKGKSLFVRAKR